MCLFVCVCGVCVGGEGGGAGAGGVVLGMSGGGEGGMVRYHGYLINGLYNFEIGRC